MFAKNLPRRARWPTMMLLVGIITGPLCLIYWRLNTPADKISWPDVALNAGIEAVGALFSVFLIDMAIERRRLGREAPVARNVRALLQALATALGEAITILGLPVEGIESEQDLRTKLDLALLRQPEKRAGILDGQVREITMLRPELFIRENEPLFRQAQELLPLLQYDVPVPCVEALTDLLGRDRDAWFRLALRPVSPAGYDDRWLVPLVPTLLRHIRAVDKLRRGLRGWNP